MVAVKTNLMLSDLPDDLKSLRRNIERYIPVGRNFNKTTNKNVESLSLWNNFKNLTPVKNNKISIERPMLQLGSLGAGNHYVELCADEQEFIWLTLHSGSRNIGKRLADYHINIAKQLEYNYELPDPDLAMFLNGTQQMKDYRHDLYWAQQYATENRKEMMRRFKNTVWSLFPDVKFDTEINCHHNYVSEETHYGEHVFVTRKGAISAQKDELGIIPGSMGTGSYIVKGLGNPESFCSASHGAGRRMSRGQAKREFTVEDLQIQTTGVECRKDSGVLDEIPGAYKDIDNVMKNQSDLVIPVARLTTLLCVKG